MRAEFFDLLISVAHFSRLFICTKHVQNMFVFHYYFYLKHECFSLMF